VLPAERGEMGEQRIRYRVAAAAHRVERPAEIDRVPQHDRRRDERETARPMVLGLGGAIVQPSEAVKADGTSQSIVALALVEFGGRLTPKRGRSSQSMAWRVRSTRPISRSARVRPFWRG